MEAPYTVKYISLYGIDNMFNKQDKVVQFQVTPTETRSNLVQHCLIMNPHNMCNKIATLFLSQMRLLVVTPTTG